MRKKIAILMMFVLVMAFCIPAAASEDESYQLQVGAAVRDVTPTDDMFPMKGTANQNLVGVIDPLHVRVIALNDGEETALIVVWEMAGGPSAEQFVTALSEETGVPYDAIFYCATHSHTGTSVKNLELDFSLSEDEMDNQQKWLLYAYNQMLDAANEAIDNMEPATMGIGYTDSYINVNRNRTYTDENGDTYRAQGYDPTGVSDKTLAVIEFDNMDGDPIAFIVHYAVHGVVMYENNFDGEGGVGVSSDLPGYVSTCLETEYDGSVALWISGAAGDQNPVIGNEYFTPSIETGEQEISTFRFAPTELLEILGKLQFADVKTALSNIDEMTSDVKISYGYDGTTIPDTAEDSDEWGVYLHLLRLGDVALVGSGGELFCSLGLDMKENSPLENTLVVNHALTHNEEYSGYIADDEGLLLGGQGTDATYEVGYISDALVDVMNGLIEASEE